MRLRSNIVVSLCMKWGNSMKRLLRVTILAFALIALICFLCGCKSCNDEQDTSSGSDNPSATVELLLNKTEIEALIGDTQLLLVKNAGVAPQDVVWTSENPAVASVSADGMVEAVSVGSTNIKAVCGNAEAVCKINVTLGNEIPRLVIENERESYRVGKNEAEYPFELYVLFNGKKFYDAEIVGKSFDDSVVTFSETEQGKMLIQNVGETSVAFSATWRGISDKQLPSLYKLVNITVVEEVYFYVNGLQYDEIELSTLAEFAGESYVNQMLFVPSVSVDGEASNNVSFLLPEEILEQEGNVVRAKSYGEGTITLLYKDAANNEYQSTIKVKVTRPETTYAENIDYFSTFTGAYKDAANGYADTTLVKTLFGTDTVENVKAYYDGEELTVDNGKILGLPNDYRGAYEATLRVENNQVVYYVNVNVYGLVVQSGADLELFALKFLRTDNPLTAGVDETQVTRIDGYCVLLNDIDATGVTIDHEIFDVTYPYVNSKNETQQVGVTMSRYNTSVQVNSATGAYDNPDGLDAFGFLGRFDGQGYTISNLDTSVAANKTGGGLFGYLFGNAIVENVGFANLKISNSSGLAYGSFIPIPRPSAKDVKGLRTDNTEYRNIYIELSADTINPKGALVNTPYGNTLGLMRWENIIVNATAVKQANTTAGSLLIHNVGALCAENIGTRFYSQNVYLIGEMPAYFNANVSVYGKNEANGNELNTQIGNEVYSCKFKRYPTFEEMELAENDYSSFNNSAWVNVGYPVFKTASGVYGYYLNESVLDGTVKVNSATTGKPLTLATLSGEAVAVEEYIYNSAQLHVDENGNIRLAQAVETLTEYEITLTYHYRGEDGALTLKVLASPEVFTVNKIIEMSAHDGVFDLSKYVESPKKIQSVTQKINGNTYDLAVDANGNIKAATVLIKPDYSDVYISELSITTADMNYKFPYVKIYSHILKTAADLEVFKHTQATSKITGYYVLDKNINANGTGVAHDDSAFGSTTLNTEHVFQGVFDGRGYAIYNFRPTVGGLLGAVYSDSAENGGGSVVKNVAFINVQSESGKDFTVLGKFIHSVGYNVTDVTNVHVEIANTYWDDYHSCSNYKGLFQTNSSTEVNTFKFTNVYVTIKNEQTKNMVGWAYGSLLSRDGVGVGYKANLTTRSARFDNVITVTQMNPCLYRQSVSGGGLAEEFNGIHMYFVYAENDVGKQGIRCNWLPEDAQYPHNPISENAEKGSYLYNNVYRYDTENDVASEKLQTLVNSGLWVLNAEGGLQWKSTIEVTEPEMNFDVDWLNPILS